MQGPAATFKMIVARSCFATGPSRITSPQPSNNSHAQGSFGVISVGTTGDNLLGAIEYSRFDRDGIITHYFDNHESTLKALNIEVLNRLGEPAHFGRLHLWFKIHVLHG